MKDLRIGVRLGIGFMLVLAMMALMTGFGIWRLQAVADATRDMTQQALAKERLISDWYRSIHSSARRTMAIAKSADPSLVSFFAAETKASIQVVANLQKQIEPLIRSEAEQALWQQLQDKRKLYISSRDGITKAKSEGQIEEAERLLEGVFVPAANVYLDLIQQLLDTQRRNIDASAAQIDSIYQKGRNLLIALGALALLLGAACARWLTVGITRPLNTAVRIARTVSSGDLTSRFEVHSKDETGQLLHALREMNDSLARIVSDVRSGTETIATASHQISSGNLDLSARTEQQAGSLEETASSMEELTSTVKQNADNARQANMLATSASEVALRGGTVVQQVVQTMGSIDDSSRKIVDIISVIDGIAFQTNILALNAAVEAARAGEQGRGFAVVAAEVRNLAQRSSAAAREIKALIDNSVEKVGAGSRLVNQAGETMGEIVDSVRRVTDIMAEIAAASQEQTSGIEQVNQAIAHMDQATQQNAALVEEAAAAAAAMQEQTVSLARMVSMFRLDDRQDAVHTASVATPTPAATPVLTVSTQPARLSRPAPARGDDWEEF